MTELYLKYVDYKSEEFKDRKAVIQNESIWKNSVSLTLEFLKEIPTICKTQDEDNQNIFYIYNGKYYEMIEDKELELLFMDFLVRYNITHCWKSAKKSEVFSAIRSFRSIPNVEMNGSNDYIIVNNGVVHIESGDLLPHSESYYYDSMIDIKYDKKLTYNECPNFVNFVSQVLRNDKDNIENALRLGGYLFDITLQANSIFLLNGPGGSGKTTFVECLSMFFEKSKQVSSLSLEDISRPGFHKERLLTSRFNWSGETKTAYLDAENLKLIAEGSPMTIDRKFKPTITVRLKAKTLANCNGLPKYNDKSDGIFRRLVVFPFDNKYKAEYEFKLEKDPELRHIYIQDRELIGKIKSEKEAVFNVFLSALRRLRADKYMFIKNDKYMAFIKGYKCENDSIEEFIIENYEADTTSITPISEILNDYRRWYYQNVQDGGTVKLRANELGRRIIDILEVNQLETRVISKDIDGNTTSSRAYPVKKKTYPEENDFSERIEKLDFND